MTITIANFMMGRKLVMKKILRIGFVSFIIKVEDYYYYYYDSLNF